jgi:nitrogen-specific signal transduction histidine kinase
MVHFHGCTLKEDLQKIKSPGMMFNGPGIPRRPQPCLRPPEVSGRRGG